MPHILLKIMTWSWLLLALLPLRLRAEEGIAVHPYTYRLFTSFPDNPQDAFHSEFEVSGQFSFTGSEDVHAIRQTVSNQTDSPRTLVLVHYALIEDIRIYIKREDGRIESKRSGIKTKMSERDLDDKDYAFAFTLAPHEQVEIISAAQSRLSFNMRNQVLDKEVFLLTQSESGLYFGLYIGAVLFIGFVSLVLYWNTKENIFLYYFSTVIFTHLLGTLTPFGIINKYVIREFPYLALKSVTVILCLTVISSMLFCQQLLGTKKRLPSLHRAINTSLWISLGLIVATLLSNSFTISALADATSAVAMFLALFAGIFSLREKSAASYYLVGWMLFFAGAGIFILQDNGFITANDFTRHALIFGSLFECLFFIQAISKGLLRAKSELERRTDELSSALNRGGDESLLSGDAPTNVRQTKELYLSIMFIDTVEFSTTMSMNPDDPINIVDQLGENFFRIRKIIHSHDGIIVNTGGDSVFALFGFASAQEISHKNHALSALDCAKAVREMCLEHIESARNGLDAIFPLRIGLHIGDVIIKDLGDERNADITGLGIAVNYASRIEQASYPLGILMSEAFGKVLLTIDSQMKFHKKIIKIKHKKGYSVAWELETKSTTEEETRHDSAVRKINGYFQREQKENRMNIRQLDLKAETDLGYFKILDFSLSGFLLESMDFYPASDINLRITDILDTNGHSLLELDPAQKQHHHVKATIRWSKPIPLAYQFGLQIEIDSTTTGRTFFDLLYRRHTEIQSGKSS